MLLIETSVQEVRSASLIMKQRFLCEQKELVVITLEVVFVHPKTMRPIRIPLELKTLFEKEK